MIVAFRISPGIWMEECFIKCYHLFIHLNIHKESYVPSPLFILGYHCARLSWHMKASESRMRDRHVNSIPWKLYVEVYAGDHGPQEMQPSTSHEDQGSVLEEVILWGRRWSLPVKRLNFPGGGKSLCAAAAKSLQLCPTLCHPIDGSPPGSAIPGILQARTLEWVAISFSNSMCEKASNTWKSPELQEAWWGWWRGEERRGRDVQRCDKEGAFMPCQHVWSLANEIWGEMHLRIISRGVM